MLPPIVSKNIYDFENSANERAREFFIRVIGVDGFAEDIFRWVSFSSHNLFSDSSAISEEQNEVPPISEVLLPIDYLTKVENCTRWDGGGHRLTTLVDAEIIGLRIHKWHIPFNIFRSNHSIIRMDATDTINVNEWKRLRW